VDALTLLKNDHGKVKKMLSELEELGQRMQARKEAGLAA
jgi:hypothetical protein